MLRATLCIDGVETPDVMLHDAPSDDRPYLFIEIRHGGAVSLWTHDPADLRRIGDRLIEAARQLEAAIEGRKAPVEA